LSGGEITVPTAVATTIVVVCFYYFVVRKQRQRELARQEQAPKQTSLKEFEAKEDGEGGEGGVHGDKTDDSTGLPRVP
jgi:hypothetical protein